MPIRVSEIEETAGLDIAQHGEMAYGVNWEEDGPQEPIIG